MAMIIEQLQALDVADSALVPPHVIEPLDTRIHDRTQFDCGEPSLNSWLREFAGQATKKDGARTYVACEEGRVVGYYSLCTFSLEKAGAPKQLQFGPYEIPALLLARLAVDVSKQSDGLGSFLLLDALRVAALVADAVGARVMVVHALHDNAAAFYSVQGFGMFETDPLTLYLPMKDIRATLAAAGMR